jgi:DNA end-binding protein Ku
MTDTLEVPYSIAPTDQVGQEAFVVIPDAIRAKKMAVLARVVLTRRECVIKRKAFHKGLLWVTHRYPYRTLRDRR